MWNSTGMEAGFKECGVVVFGFSFLALCFDSFLNFFNEVWECEKRSTQTMS